MSPHWPVQDQVIDEALLSTIGITDHALDQFVERAQPGLGAAGRAEAVLRDCMVVEGRATYERPRWSRSSRPADWYVQIGEFLLCIVEWDDGYGNWGVWTVVNGVSWKTWSVALERGWTRIPMPVELAPPTSPRPLALLGTLRAARQLRRRSGEKLGMWRAMRLAREAHASGEEDRYLTEEAAYEAEIERYHERRERAYAAHRRRFGS